MVAPIATGEIEDDPSKALGEGTSSGTLRRRLGGR
jgi:hypothetical protein